MPLWKNSNDANSAPLFVTNAANGNSGKQEYGTNVIYVHGVEGFPVAPGWARKLTAGGRTRWESLVPMRRSPALAAFATYLTAGGSGAWKGFSVADSWGSITRQPIEGFPMNFFAHNATDGSLAFTGNCLSQVTGKKVYVNGVEMAGGTWAFSSGNTTYTWSGSVPQVFTVGQSYVIEVK